VRTNDQADVDELPISMTRNAAGVITSIENGIVDLLGWAPEQLIGSPSTRFIHPEDQASAIAAWMKMITAPGTTSVWRGRYQTLGGAWQWVETVNTYEEDGVPAVFSSMTRVTVEQVSVEEELRSRTQMLSRLSDALPVGLFEIDASRQIKFTNDRLHLIVGLPPAATIDAQLANLVADDEPILRGALAAVLAGEGGDDIEIRLEDPADGWQRVCLLSLRALTDNSGTVSGAIGLLSDVTDRVQLRRELEIRASVDQLTSCMNRAATLDLLRTVLERNEAAEGTAVVFVDLDRFKPVNDRFGHAAGDRLLVVAADRMRLALRSCDRVGRVGGDEFLVVCPNVDNAARATEIGDRLAAALHATVDVGPAVVDLRASIGVAWTREVVDPDSLIARADAAMYRSKRHVDIKVTMVEVAARQPV
jgi:diguanylate cyclase (GGDEF)-like protein/PAS domain S-box-containing protein